MLHSPAVQNSGQGGRFILPTVNITAPGGEFGSIPVGAPFFGHDDNDMNICQCLHFLHFADLSLMHQTWFRVFQRHPRRIGVLHNGTSRVPNLISVD